MRKVFKSLAHALNSQALVSMETRLQDGRLVVSLLTLKKINDFLQSWRQKANIQSSKFSKIWIIIVLHINLSKT